MHKDYFSTQADAYKKFRPRYPRELYKFLLNDLPTDGTILDCATGNGQAALDLVNDKARVIGIDLSFQQLSNAPQHTNCLWSQAMVESLPIASETIDLAVIAQALHWFDFERFYPEIKRVLRPNGRIAAWTYSLLAACNQFGPNIESVVRWFYHDVVGDYWPPERRWVDDEYRGIPFPFEDIPTPVFVINLCWDRYALVGYVSSWSAVQLYTKQTGANPIPLFVARLDDVWPHPNHELRFSWPLSLRVGR